MRLNFFKKQIQKPQWPSANDAAAAFLADPAKCLFGTYQTEYCWDKKDMNFSFHGRQIAYVHGIDFLEKTIVQVNKIAVENDMLRQGVGHVLVHWLAIELTRRDGVVEIRFHQGNDTSYPAFFNKLGAVAVPDQLRTDRNWPIWVLRCS